MKKKYIIVGITFCFILISGFCYSCAYQDDNSSKAVVTSLSSEEENTEQEKEEQTSEQINSEKTESDLLLIEKEETTISTDIYVHICGAVVNPGVYKADSEARLFDLIELSGGLQKAAASDYINQAQPVFDGQRIYIPTKEEVNKLMTEEYIAGSQDSDENTKASSALIDINTATSDELMELPGIGQVKADSIINYRSMKGDFNSIEELKNIPGIKEGLFQRISSYIIVK